MSTPSTRRFTVAGHQLAYDLRGNGDRTVVLIPGLLMTRRMQWPLADELAAAGLRVACLDPLGFGESDRPAQYWHYSMPLFATQVIALLDELGVEKAVVGGTSAGANITLATAVAAPERLHGIVVESPVLDRAMLACAIGMVPMLGGFTVGAPLARGLARAARRIPRGSGFVTDLLLDWFADDPGPKAAALQGIILGGPRVPRDVRRRIPVPALVLGSKVDPVHRMADNLELVDDLARAQFVRTRSVLDLRQHPERFAPKIAEFIDTCWPAAATSRPAARDIPA